MRLIYVGPHDAVEVPLAGIVAEREKPVDVPDDEALKLLEQRENWAKAPGAKPDDKGGK